MSVHRDLPYILSYRSLFERSAFTKGSPNTNGRMENHIGLCEWLGGGRDCPTSYKRFPSLMGSFLSEFPFRQFFWEVGSAEEKNKYDFHCAHQIFSGGTVLSLPASFKRDTNFPPATSLKENPGSQTRLSRSFSSFPRLCFSGGGEEGRGVRMKRTPLFESRTLTRI